LPNPLLSAFGVRRRPRLHDRRREMKIRDVMTRDAKLINPDDTLQDVAKLMKDYDCGVLPVREGDRLTG
jgi:CBS domain-containing protein